MNVEKQGYCTLCRSRCGTINVVDGDALIAVRPDLAHPTGKAICMKGKAAPELVHSPHRILYPRRRSKPKGDPDPGWVRISWEAALEEIAARLLAIRAASGAEAVAFATATPSGTSLSDSIDWIDRLVHHFGSPNVISSTEVCNWHRDEAHKFTFGCAMPPADYANSDLILLWGHNPSHTWLSQAHAIGLGRARGARMLVVDPRPTSLARDADVWLRVRPGADASLAMGLVHLLIRSDLFDRRFVREWTNGPLLVRSDTGRFLRERDLWPHSQENRAMVWLANEQRIAVFDTDVDPLHSAGDYALHASIDVDIDRTPVACHTAFELLCRESAAYDEDTVSNTTGVPVADLRAAAELIGTSRRIGYHSWTGIAQHTNATQAERATAVLYALTGSFDVVGGNRVRPGPPTNGVTAPSALSPEQRAKTLGTHDRPLGPAAAGRVSAIDAYRAMLEGKPYRIRALVGFGTNLLVSLADTSLAMDALKSLEFHVHCDLFDTPTTQYADIVLPVNTAWEREGLRVGFDISDDAEQHIQFRQRMVTPRGESRSDTDIVFDLACRLGLKTEFFDGDIEQAWNHQLAPTGLTVDELRKFPGGVSPGGHNLARKYASADRHRRRGFDTETRRVELYSELMHRHGQPALPRHVEPVESPLDDASTRSGQFPYVLSSVKNGYYCHSQMRSLSSLRRRAPQPVVEIGAGLARRHRLADGDWARINTRMGSARFVVRIAALLADNVVLAEYGWWQACDDLGLEATSLLGATGSNFNSLISAEDRDPVSGSVAHRSFLCNIEADTVEHSRQRRWAGSRAFQIASLAHDGEGVMQVELAPVDGLALPDYLPGQHISVHLTLPDGSLVSRAYSLTGPRILDGRQAFSIAVRHQESMDANGERHEGRLSGFLHREARVGDRIGVAFPSGLFTIPARPTLPVVMIAGGIGITPFISLLRSLGEPSVGPELLLYYANKSSATHAFREELQQLQRRQPRLRVVDHYTNPEPHDVFGKDYLSTLRLGAHLVDESLIVDRARFYLCGPKPMMDEIGMGLRSRGVPASDIFSEVFRSPAQPPTENGKTFSVTFSRSRGGKDTWTPGDGTLLAFGEKLGVSLSSGCRVGQCESCAVRIIAGEATHLHGAEPEDAGACLLCQAIPTTDIVIDA